MDAPYWIKQPQNELAFPEIEWSKPENKSHAGRLVIIGGNTHGFSSVAEAFTLTSQAGIGNVKAILPEAALKQLAGAAPVGLESAASNASGGFSRDSLRQLLSFAVTSDGLLLAGDFGRNSETAITINDLLKKFSGPVIATKDTINYFVTDAESIRDRKETILVLNLAQLQKLTKTIQFDQPILFEAGIATLVASLHTLTTNFPFGIITMHHSHLIVAIGGQVSTTPHTQENLEELWQLQIASKAAVYTLQHPGKVFEALTSSVAKQ